MGVLVRIDSPGRQSDGVRRQDRVGADSQFRRRVAHEDRQPDGRCGSDGNRKILRIVRLTHQRVGVRMVKVVRFRVQTEGIPCADACGTADRQLIFQRGILDRRPHRETEFRRVQRVQEREIPLNERVDLSGQLVQPVFREAIRQFHDVDVRRASDLRIRPYVRAEVRKRGQFNVLSGKYRQFRSRSRFRTVADPKFISRANVREYETDAEEILECTYRNVSRNVIFRRGGKREKFRSFQHSSIFHRQCIFRLNDRYRNTDIQRNGPDCRRKSQEIRRPAGVDRGVHPRLQIDILRQDLRTGSDREIGGRTILHERKTKIHSACSEGCIRGGVRLGIQIAAELDPAVKQDERVRFVDSPGIGK